MTGVDVGSGSSVHLTHANRQVMTGMPMNAFGSASASLTVQHLTGEMPAMMVAHLVAAAVLGMWLAAGERMLWRTVVLMAGPVVRATVQVLRALLAAFRAGLSTGAEAQHQRCRPPRWPDRALRNRLSPPTATVRRSPPMAGVPITTAAF